MLNSETSLSINRQIMDLVTIINQENFVAIPFCKLPHITSSHMLNWKSDYFWHGLVLMCHKWSDGPILAHTVRESDMWEFTKLF